MVAIVARRARVSRRLALGYRKLSREFRQLDDIGQANECYAEYLRHSREARAQEKLIRDLANRLIDYKRVGMFDPHDAMLGDAHSAVHG